MDWLLWIVKAAIIVAGVILVIIIWNRKMHYSFGILMVGITALILGVVLLIVSLVTELSLLFAVYLIAAGIIAIVMGSIIWSILRKSR